MWMRDLCLNLPVQAKARHGFLHCNASSADRIAAAARNHAAFFTAAALASDREVQHHDSVLFTVPDRLHIEVTDDPEQDGIA